MKKLAVWFTVIACLWMIASACLVHRGVSRTQSLSREIAKKEEENRLLKEQIQQLTRQINATSGQAALEHVIREDLGLVGSGEMVFLFNAKGAQ